MTVTQGQTTHDLWDEHHVVVLGVLVDPDHTPEQSSDALSLSLDVYEAVEPDEDDEEENNRGQVVFEDAYWIKSRNDQQVRTDLEGIGMSNELIESTLRVIHKLVDLWDEERGINTNGS